MKLKDGMIEAFGELYISIEQLKEMDHEEICNMLHDY